MYSNEKTNYKNDPTTFSSPSFPPPSAPEYQKPSCPPQYSQEDEEVRDSPTWNDISFAIIFILHFLISIAISVYFSQISNSKVHSLSLRGLSFDSIKPYLMVTFISLFSVAAVLSTSLLLMRKKAETFLRVSFLSFFAMIVLSSICILVKGKGTSNSMICAGIDLFIGIMILFSYHRRDKAFAFSASILQQIEKANAAYSGIWVLAAINLISIIVYGAYFIFSISIIILSKESVGQEILVPAFLYAIFSFYWTTQVIGNVFQTSFAGVYATYFFSGPPAESSNHKTCVNSLFRASTYSFGSICFGSLIVAILQFLQFLLRSAKNSSRNNRDLVTTCCILISALFLDLIESLVEYFNYYAYTYIAIYGKGYLESAKDTWELVKNSGIQAIINDCLISYCLFLTSITMIAVSFLLCYLMSASPMSYLISITITILSCFAFCNVISSGATTFFVCLAESPEKYRVIEPEMYTMTLEKYPELSVA